MPLRTTFPSETQNMMVSARRAVLPTLGVAAGVIRIQGAGCMIVWFRMANAWWALAMFIRESAEMEQEIQAKRWLERSAVKQSHATI